MIGKSNWFTYRIFGWGLRPKTWQGWIYILVFIGIFIAIAYLPFAESTKPWILGVLFLILIVDTIIMMTQLDKHHDERQRMQQLIIERNCSFAAIASLLGVLFYIAYKNTGLLASNTLTPEMLPVVIVLGVMLVTKVVSTIYVNRNM